MKRLGISVEGSTEREFVNLVLRPHLEKYHLSVTAIDIKGNVSLDKIRGVLPALLGSYDYVSTFYDYYGFKKRESRSVVELETAIGGLIETKRLIPYIQQYEFEALIFAAIAETIEWLEGTPSQHIEMQKAVKQSGSPELVNNSPQTSPSHRLKKLFPTYDKPLHGSVIIDSAGLEKVRKQCPRFDAWVMQIEQLGELLK